MPNSWTEAKTERAFKLWMQGNALTEICFAIRGVTCSQLRPKLARRGGYSSEALKQREINRRQRLGLPLKPRRMSRREINAILGSLYQPKSWQPSQ